MHLCETCRSERDWENDTVVQWQIKANLARKDDDPAKARCAECTRIGTGMPTRIGNPLFQICKRCAERLRQCQHCRASTLSSPEQASQDAFEALFDAFVTLVKTYGATIARQMLSKADLAPEERAHVATLVRLDVSLVDSMQPQQAYYYRQQRPIWTKVWGQLSFKTCAPHCTRCVPPSRYAPAMVRAECCGHWTAGHQAAWCLVCAVEQRQCAICEAPTE